MQELKNKNANPSSCAQFELPAKQNLESQHNRQKQKYQNQKKKTANKQNN